ncbi:hypothetical protein EDB86DRAFT_2966390 [Lactarius hatsudake]|nr:hypothetical protein EDB86DRAFT_2966390 [Lactarius hatsudake]
MPRSNKRKRASRVQAEIPDEDDAPAASVLEDDELDTEKLEHKEESVEVNHRLEVEAELWDLFREEFHEEVVRGSQEKVGLAQAAYDSVDRHIRQLDQSIREQEMSISFGLRQGTHPSLLPDLAAPSRWARPTRVTHSPIPGLSEDEEVTAPKISASSEVTIGMATGSEATRGPPSKKGKKGKRRKSDKAVSETEVAPPVVVSSTRSLRLKVPPLNSTAQADAAADPDEPKYCYCNRVSFGNMVACDYPQCKREWFHLDCAGLTEEPQSRTWYCRECEPLVRKTEQGGTRRRGR